MWRIWLLVVACQPWSDVDLDGDGFGPEDCDDGDPLRFPGAPDTVGDGIDQDCDGVDGLDVDGDGWAGEASGGEDCDDRDPLVFPGAEERCNGIDDDCDGAFPLDEADVDLDGFRVCEGDCDDGSPGVSPNAPEFCGEDLNCDGVATPCSERSEVAIGSGQMSGDDFGWSLASADLDQDGRLDLLVGAPGVGQVFVYAGPLASAVGDGWVHSWLATGEDGLGSAMAAGPAGVALGAPGDDAGGLDAGAVWVIPTGSELSDLSETAVKWVGEAGGDQAGTAVVPAGDPDGDGDQDWLIAAESAGVGGVVYLVDSGVTSDTNLAGAPVRFVSSVAGQMAGHALASGDVNGDGLSDLWIGAPGAAGGAAYLILGRTSSMGAVVSLDDSDAVVLGLTSGDQLGWSLSVVDVDGDGFDDTWIGAPGAGGGKGSAYLLMGAQEGVSADLTGAYSSWQGDTDGLGLGERVAFADGLVASGSGDAPGLQAPGMLWWSQDVPPTAGLVVWGPAFAEGAGEQDRFGAALEVGDVNGDGAADLVVGAPWAGASGQGPGEVSLWLGESPE